MKLVIYHNTRCTKSREACSILKENGVEFETIEYLKNVPTKAELIKLLAKLNLKPEEIVRKKEPIYLKKLKGLKLNDEEWLQILIENPILIERPIIVKGNKAIIGRPPERVLELL